MRYLTGAALAALLASAGTALAQAPATALAQAPATALAQAPATTVAQVPATTGSPPPPANMLFAPPAVFDWSGWYAGANMGGAFSTNDVQFRGSTTPGTALSSPWGGTASTEGAIGRGQIPGTLARNPAGFTTGLELGYNFLWGPAIIGFVDDINYSGVQSYQNRLTTVAAPAFPTQTTAQQNLNWFGTARGKIGFSPWSPVELFATGGLAYGQARVASSVSTVSVTGGANCAGFCGRGTTNPVNVGWTAGGGWEWAFAPNLSLKGEYLYVDLGDVTQAYSDCCGRFPGTNVRTKTTIADNVFRVAVDYHFGAPPPPPPAPMAMPAPPPAAPKVFIVFFDWDKDTITPEGHQIIAQAADAWKSGAPVQLQVTGYTDRSGSPGYNQRLSERRANNVARALNALGVPREDMIVAGRGENDNRVPTAPGVREPQNRRVEIVSP
jgi:outer membrane protein OmpA-like peptidoglycan-associated protein/uncharacterized protein YhjY with autotransporter beta-barrel domain